MGKAQRPRHTVGSVAIHQHRPLICLSSPSRFFASIITHVLLRSLMIEALDATPVNTTPYCEHHGVSYNRPVIEVSFALSRPSARLLVQWVLDQAWKASSSHTSARAPTIKLRRTPGALCGFGGSASAQTTTPLAFATQVFASNITYVLLPTPLIAALEATPINTTP